MKQTHLFDLPTALWQAPAIECAASLDLSPDLQLSHPSAPFVYSGVCYCFKHQQTPPGSGHQSAVPSRPVNSRQLVESPGLRLECTDPAMESIKD